VILTKDNLAKRNCEVVRIALSVAYRKQSFIFVAYRKHHLFFKCDYARFLWTTVHMLFGIPKLTDINDLFNRWSKRGSIEYNSSLLIGALALCLCG